MKRVIAFIMCFVLVFSMSAVAFADYPTPRIAFRITRNAALLRRGPGEHFTPIGQFTIGDIFWVQHGEDAPWYYGSPDTDTGIYDEFGYVEGYVHESNMTVY